MDQENKKPADTGSETSEASSAEEFTDADAEAAFAEGLGETASETPDGTTDKKTAPKGSETTDDTGQTGAAGKETPGDETDTGGKPSEKPSYEDLEKQLKDTQTWAHGLSETNAELKKKLESTEKKPGTGDDDSSQEPELPEEIKSYFDDYPEAKQAFEYLAKKMLGGMKPEEVQKTVAGMQNQLDQANFEKAVVIGFMAEDGKWIDGHPDAYKVMATNDYKKWFDAELKRNPSIGNISDPKAAIDVISQYKTQKASNAAASHDAGMGGGMAQDVKDIAAGAVETGSSTGPEDKPKTDEDKSPDEIFEEHAT